MNYQDALDYLYSFLDSEAKLPRLPAEFNLPRTSALLAAVGDPQQHFRSIVVAGTKGKGSTSVMIEAILRAAGYRTGLWTSPHLHSYRERVQIDRQPITREELVAQVERLRPTIDAFDTKRYGEPTVFDLGFALALDMFARRGVDVAVLEVGLGGRYDSANAITPVLSLITSISYDHMQTLGNSLAEIAYQKAGIAKPGVPLITVRQEPEAMTVIEQITREVGAPLYRVDAHHAPDAASPPSLRIGGQVYGGALDTALPGTFQRENARLAAGAALLLREHGFDITDAVIADGLVQARWPGRFEVVPGAPVFVLDGAHNGDSATKLVDSLREQFPGKHIVFVFGTTRDKDVTRMFDMLLPVASALVFTHSRHPRAEIELERLAEQAREIMPGIGGQIMFAEDVPEAIDQARALAGEDGLVCVTGSLFVVAAAREALGLPHERD